LFEYILKMQFIPVMAKLNFQHHYSSHMIILICWFGAQEMY